MKNLNYNIAVIGAGALGRRHLEALLKLTLPIKTTVIDPSSDSLNMAKSVNAGDNRIAYHKDFKALPSEIDFAVIATNSKQRREVTEELLSRSTVRYVLLEKVLFPQVSDYAAIAQLLDRTETSAWVNCGRRVYPFYQSLKARFADEREIFVTITGGSWGLCCNTVHMLDLIAFLNGSPDGFKLDVSHLNDGYIAAKRAGYIEFTGLLTGSSPKCPSIVISCECHHSAPLTINIQSERYSISINEHIGSAVIFCSEGNWQPEHIHFETPYQSQLTGGVFEELIGTEKCKLTPFDESVKIHIPMLDAFLKHYSKSTGRVEVLCPIT